MSKSENASNCHTFSNGIKVGYFVRNQAEDIQDESTYYIRKNHIVGNQCDEFIDLPETVLEKAKKKRYRKNGLPAKIGTKHTRHRMLYGRNSDQNRHHC